MYSLDAGRISLARQDHHLFNSLRVGSLSGRGELETVTLELLA